MEPNTANSSRISRLSREGSWVVLGQVAVVTGSIVLVRVLTQYLHPTQYGQLALGLTLAVLVNQVTMGAVAETVGRYYSVAVERKYLGGYLRDSARLLLVAVALTSMFGAIGVCSLLLLGMSSWIPLVMATLLLALVNGARATLTSIQAAARQRAVVAFHTGLDAWLKIPAAVTAIFLMGTSSTAVIVGYAASSTLVAVFQFMFLRRSIRVADLSEMRDAEFGKQMWAYGWPFATWGVFTWMQLSSDRWALELFSNTEEVGQYSVLFQLGYTPIVMATGMAVSFLAPIFYARTGDAKDTARHAGVERTTWKLTIACLAFAMAGGAAAFTFHESIFALFVGAHFRRASRLLPWVVLSGGLFAAGQVLSLKLMSELKSGRMVTAKIVSSLVGVAANVIGAWKLGLIGVLAGLLIYSTIYLSWMLMLTRKVGGSR